MKNIRPGQFMRRLRKKNRLIHRPLSAMVELTYKCNHKCIHCYNPEGKKKKEMTKKEVFSILDQLKNMGTLQVSFTGGEIFTRPDIMDIIFYTRKKGLRLTLMTNGSLITKKIADKLIHWGIGKYEISFLGATKHTFDKITRVKGSFEKVVKRVEMLRKKGVIPKIKTCFIKTNLHEAEEIAELAKKLDVSFSYSPLVIPRLDLEKTPGCLRINPEDFLSIGKRFSCFRSKKAIKKRRTVRKNRLGFWEKENIFNCQVGRITIFINPYGEVKPCLTIGEPSYSALKIGAQKAWENIKKFAHTIKPPPRWACTECEYQDWCSWCPGRGYLNTGDIFGCPPYFKELARAGKKRAQVK